MQLVDKEHPAVRAMAVFEARVGVSAWKAQQRFVYFTASFPFLELNFSPHRHLRIDGQRLFPKFVLLLLSFSPFPFFSDWLSSEPPFLSPAIGAELYSASFMEVGFLPSSLSLFIVAKPG
jgi:hypothetical protein